MSFILHPWQLLLIILAGWISQQQQEVIEYLRTENQVLKEKLGKKRVLLTDDQRRRLAVAGKILGRKRLEEVGTLFTPDTILRWHRMLVAKKWDASDKRKHVGRPRIRQVIVDLILRFAQENPTWGFDRIQGALANVGYPISDTTVGNVLKQHGIQPAPDRKRQTTWATFLKAHGEVLAAIDFTTVEVWTKRGLVTHYLLFVMALSPRAASTWPVARPVLGEPSCDNRLPGTDEFRDGFLNGKRYLIMDRDCQFCDSFRAMLEDAGVKLRAASTVRSPNLNPHLERFRLSLKSEMPGANDLLRRDIVATGHPCLPGPFPSRTKPPGLGNKLLEPGNEVGRIDGDIQCRESLGGLLKYYHRSAA